MNFIETDISEYTVSGLPVVRTDPKIPRTSKFHNVLVQYEIRKIMARNIKYVLKP